jgi:hypothetical protein
MLVYWKRTSTCIIALCVMSLRQQVKMSKVLPLAARSIKGAPPWATANCKCRGRANTALAELSKRLVLSVCYCKSECNAIQPSLLTAVICTACMQPGQLLRPTHQVDVQLLRPTAQKIGLPTWHQCPFQRFFLHSSPIHVTTHALRIVGLNTCLKKKQRCC